MLQIRSTSVDETIKFGFQVSDRLFSGCIVYLVGDVGSGKTHLVKGIAAGLGIKDMIKSPTYTVVRQYSNDSINLYHADFYRLSSEHNLDVEGIEEMIEDKKGIFLFEWPKNVNINKINPHFVIQIDYIDASTRNIKFE